MHHRLTQRLTRPIDGVRTAVIDSTQIAGTLKATPIRVVPPQCDQRSAARTVIEASFDDERPSTDR